MTIKDFIKPIIWITLRSISKITKKNKKTIFFYPHENCLFDGYDILNGDSSNVLCLLNNMIRDSNFNDYHFYILYYHANKLSAYKEYCKQFRPERIHFVFFQAHQIIAKAVCKSYTIFTDSDYTRIEYKVSSQRCICLNYFGGLIKNEFHRWTNHGGFKKMLKEQKDMYRMFDKHLSTSDISSKFIALDNCHYYPHFVSLGFPRNDVLFRNHSSLRDQIKALVNFKVNKIITYVPTHRDYENPEREFYDDKKIVERSIFGKATKEELEALERCLAETDTLIIAKVHPVQQAKTHIIKDFSNGHILFYKDIASKIMTSLNPILAISDALITDYTTTVYDFLYLNRPIIYYFYDVDIYRATRGFFIEPIESVCAGHMTYNISELQFAIKDVSNGNDPWKAKRQFLQELFIKNNDDKACERIKEYFFRKEIK